jgi:hypothetical protein
MQLAAPGHFTLLVRRAFVKAEEFTSRLHLSRTSRSLMLKLEDDLLARLVNVIAKGLHFFKIPLTEE